MECNILQINQSTYFICDALQQQYKNIGRKLDTLHRIGDDDGPFQYGGLQSLSPPLLQSIHSSYWWLKNNNIVN